ncbi:MAG: hypothetical protein A3F78_17655 [Burkholderiales bacterium RIFCSPLOWO2_12_FULL_61_40]|nr:MAG: hypothetical protein A3F78_17655 [Burkholderiales bacterium RIFCSPLOWO2_12_FULL_61_40]
MSVLQKLPFYCAHPARVVLVCGVLTVNAGTTWAALGQKPSLPTASSAPSSSPNAKQLATAPTVQSSLYTRHEIQLDSGTTVWEFATPAGVVFAVQWRGPVLPDLGHLLGDYFKVFHQETAQARTLGRHGSPVNIERQDLVIRSNGRMRNFFGHAYAPELVPAGVVIADVLQ